MHLPLQCCLPLNGGQRGLGLAVILHGTIVEDNGQYDDGAQQQLLHLPIGVVACFENGTKLDQAPLTLRVHFKVASARPVHTTSIVVAIGPTVRALATLEGFALACGRVAPVVGLAPAPVNIAHRIGSVHLFTVLVVVVVRALVTTYSCPMIFDKARLALARAQTEQVLAAHTIRVLFGAHARSGVTVDQVGALPIVR